MVSKTVVSALKKVLKNANVDKFATADVIRWDVETPRITYSYAAIKTPVGWYTTASSSAYRHVSQILTFDELVEVLSRNEVSAVEVATEWEAIR
jgi:hypothetical protein